MCVCVFTYISHSTDKYTNNKYLWENQLDYSYILILIFYYVYLSIIYISKTAYLLKNYTVNSRKRSRPHYLNWIWRHILINSHTKTHSCSLVIFDSFSDILMRTNGRKDTVFIRIHVTHSKAILLHGGK